MILSVRIIYPIFITQGNMHKKIKFIHMVPNAIFQVNVSKLMRNCIQIKLFIILKLKNFLWLLFTAIFIEFR